MVPFHHSLIKFNQNLETEKRDIFMKQNQGKYHLWANS